MANKGSSPQLRRGRADVEQQAIGADREGLVEAEIVRAVVSAKSIDPPTPSLPGVDAVISTNGALFNPRMLSVRRR